VAEVLRPAVGRCARAAGRRQRHVSARDTHGLHEAVRVVRIDEERGLTDDFGQRAAGSRHDRDAAAHCFKHGKAETLVAGRVDERVGARVQPGQIVVGNVSREDNALPDGRLVLESLEHAGRLPAGGAGEHQSESVVDGRVVDEPRETADQVREVLPRLDRREAQEIWAVADAVAMADASNRTGVVDRMKQRAVSRKRSDEDARGIDREATAEIAPRALRRADDPVARDVHAAEDASQGRGGTVPGQLGEEQGNQVMHEQHPGQGRHAFGRGECVPQ